MNEMMNCRSLNIHNSSIIETVFTEYININLKCELYDDG